MNIDTRTVFIVFTFVYAVNSIVLLFSWRIHRERFSGIFDFLLAMVLYTASHGLFALTEDIHIFFSNTLAHTIPVLGTAFLYRGFCLFLKRPPDERINYLLVALSFVFLLYFGTINPHLEIQGLLYTLFSGIIELRVMALIIKEYKENDLAKWLILGSAVFHILSSVALAPIEIGFKGRTFMEHNHLLAIDLCFILSAGVLITVAIVLMISNRLQAHERRLVKEKTLLVKEMHHRTKNNLTVINFLLKMQSDLVDDDDCRRVLRESSTRINSMASLYDILNRTDDQQSVNLKDYVKDLVQKTVDCIGLPEKQFKQHLEVPSLMMNMDYALPIGLIINELVTNSVKYAFSADEEGSISLTFKEIAKGEYELRISDSGPGLPSDYNSRNKSSLGMSIIDSLARQVGGVLSIEKEQGTCVSVRFKADLPPVAAA